MSSRDGQAPELPGIEPGKRPRGRPPKHDALTPAQRAARYRYSKAPTYAAAFKAGHWPFPTTSRSRCA